MARHTALVRPIPLAVLVLVLGLPPCLPEAAGAAPRGTVLADFESGSVVLQSYDPSQDLDPNDWNLTEQGTHGGSSYSLRLFGNTWKLQSIAGHAVTAGTYLQVAARIASIGEMQAFGISDGTNVLFYTFAGTQLPTDAEWEVAYQGAFEPGDWDTYLLPVGRDWRFRYGYDPTITGLVYVNDRDAGDDGEVLFDDVVDVTEDLPVAPTATIVTGRQRVERLAEDLFRVGVNFHADVTDPDSDVFSYSWDFGDSTFAGVADPYHEYFVHADHTFTVTLAVRDESGMWGRDTAQVVVDPGEPGGPLTMNFVGDVMLARRYDDPGGMIDQYGPEHMFVPTRGIYGDAADVSLCNLECPLTDEGEPHPTKSYVFRGRPSNVAGLTYAGIDLATIGNNHIVDYGARGLEETQEVLDAAEIRWFGAGANEYVALQPSFWTEDGVSLAFVGQCNRTGREYNYQPFLDAAANKPGFAYLTEYNVDAAIAGTRDLADLLVFQMHAGIEYATDPGAAFGIEPVDPARERAADAAEPYPGMPDFQFPTRPSLSDRQLRWRAVDQGADLVICHHPHVLQGFEVYNGVVIAHSLGNFVFDQSFAETFPTVVLTAEFDKTGFLEFTFVPAFVDRLVPRPAYGRLGREILDRMADYSRELDTIVGIDAGANRGTIYTDPGAVDWTSIEDGATVPLREQDGAWVSIPIERDGPGTLARITGIEGAAGNVEVRVGREILWHGDFEDEGATMWDLNSQDEVYDATVARQGLRSLRQHRAAGNQGVVRTDLLGFPVANGGTAYSICGFMRTQSAKDAVFTARFYSGRGGELLGTLNATQPISGTQDWTWYGADLEIPEGAGYFGVRCQMDKPNSGESYAWFDALRLVEWGAWQPAADLPIDVPHPNNLRFVQVRSGGAADSVRVLWEERTCAPSTVAIHPAPGVDAQAVRLAPAWPNPFKERTRIEYRLARAGRVRLEVFDVQGRRVARLHEGDRPAGVHRVEWEAGSLPSGLYLCRIEAAGASQAEKLILLR